MCVTNISEEEGVWYMTTFQEISDHMTCHNDCSDVISTHVYNTLCGCFFNDIYAMYYISVYRCRYNT